MAFPCEEARLPGEGAALPCEKAMRPGKGAALPCGEAVRREEGRTRRRGVSLCGSWAARGKGGRDGVGEVFWEAGMKKRPEPLGGDPAVSLFV